MMTKLATAADKELCMTDPKHLFLYSHLFVLNGIHLSIEDKELVTLAVKTIRSMTSAGQKRQGIKNIAGSHIEKGPYIFIYTNNVLKDRCCKVC